MELKREPFSEDSASKLFRSQSRLLVRNMEHQVRELIRDTLLNARDTYQFEEAELRRLSLRLLHLYVQELGWKYFPRQHELFARLGIREEDPHAL